MARRVKYRITLKRGPKGERRWECLTPERSLIRNRLQQAVVNAVLKRARAGARRGEKSQVILHGLKGRVLWERTYPRSSDPARRKG